MCFIKQLDLDILVLLNKHTSCLVFILQLELKHELIREIVPLRYMFSHKGLYYQDIDGNGYVPITSNT